MRTWKHDDLPLWAPGSALVRLAAATLAVASLAVTSEASATLFFQSGEEALSADSPLPEPKWGPYDDAWRGHVRAIADAVEGTRAIEFEALASCYVGTTDTNHDTFNELRYDVLPPPGGTLYTGVFFRTARIGGRNLWSDPDQGVETFDKAIELVGPSYRWTVNMGTRDHYYSAASEFDGKFSLFFGHPNPGHFNTEAYHCGPGPAHWEDYDSYWQNMNGYGSARPNTERYPSNSAQPFWMSYDRWYSIVTKVVFRADDTGSVEAWIDGVQVLGIYDIQTCGAEPCDHARAQLWGTYSQPAYGGPDHRRLIDALVITDDPAYLQAGGYFRAPTPGRRPTQTRVTPRRGPMEEAQVRMPTRPTRERGRATPKPMTTPQRSSIPRRRARTPKPPWTPAMIAAAPPQRTRALTAEAPRSRLGRSAVARPQARRIGAGPRPASRCSRCSAGGAWRRPRLRGAGRSSGQMPVK